MLNISGFLKVLPTVFTAWMNVFAVIIIVIAVIMLLNKLSK